MVVWWPWIRKWLIIGCGVVLVSLVILFVGALWWIANAERFRQTYERVERRMEKGEVEAMLGKPDWEKTGRPEAVYWDNQELPEEKARLVTSTWQYRAGFALYTFHFDAHGRVVGKEWQDS